jgi:hypothetical protein
MFFVMGVLSYFLIIVQGLQKARAALTPDAIAQMTTIWLLASNIFQ